MKVAKNLNVLKVYLMVLLIILIFACCSIRGDNCKFLTFNDNCAIPEIEKGFLDLRGWNFDKSGVIRLNGEWEFYWEQIINPGEFDESKHKEFISLPRSWNGFNINEKVLQGDGYATFRLILMLDSNLEFAGLEIPPIKSSYNIWINGKLYNKVGVVGSNAEEFYPKYYSDIVYFTPDKANTEIVIQAANFMHAKGGIWQPVVLGTAYQIKALREKQLAIDMFLFSSLLIIAVYNILIYLTSKKDKYALYLGLFSLLISGRSILTGGIDFIQTIRDINQERILKLEYLTLGLGVTFFTLYIDKIFQVKKINSEDNRVSNKKSSKINFNSKIYNVMKYFLYYSGILFSVFVILMPARIFSRFLIAFQIIIVVAAVYFISFFTYTLIEKKEKAYLILAGSIFFFGTIINDILYYNSLVFTRGITPLGLLVFIAVCSLLQPVNFSWYIKNLREMTGHAISVYGRGTEKDNNLLKKTTVDLSEELASTLELNKVLERLLVKLKGVLGFDAGIVMLKEGDMLKVYYKLGCMNENKAGCLNENIKNGITKELTDHKLIYTVVESRKPLIIENENDHFSIFGEENYFIKSVLALPIEKSSEALGIIILMSTEENYFNEHNAEIAFNFTSRSAMAIENAKLFSEVKRLASEDDLTQIYNRRYFFELAEREFKHHKRYKDLKPLSVIMLDIDDFKCINDTYGHYAGDVVLKKVAKVCRDVLRETDLVGRYGGEEFVMLLPHTERTEACIVGERLRKNLANCPFQYNDELINVTVSMGLAVMDENMRDLDELMIKADKALYMAKDKGKNCIVTLP
ncbi:MAG TPA: diguanylate cyclase [Clostridiales bacterium]|nr:diguanylate cyclase [Clostridiales bacterium]